MTGWRADHRLLLFFILYYIMIIMIMRMGIEQWISIMVEIFHTILLCKSTAGGKSMSNGLQVTLQSPDRTDSSEYIFIFVYFSCNTIESRP